MNVKDKPPLAQPSKSNKSSFPIRKQKKRKAVNPQIGVFLNMGRQSLGLAYQN